MQEIREHLAWTRHKLAQLMVRLLERGTTLNALEAHGQALLTSSGQFVTMVVPWHKRMWMQLQRLYAQCTRCALCGPRIIDVHRYREHGMVEM